MAKKPPIRVALDLETTGLHAEQDAILEVAAIKFQGDTILDRLETLVAPDRSIPYRVQRLTGITPVQLKGAPPFDAIARDVQHFIGDFPIVGHSIPFDVGFLRRRGLARTNPLIDTFELATVLLPSLSSYNLGQVAESLDIPVAPGRHRAMVDTVLAMNVFLALHERLQTVDLALLQDLASLDAPRNWPLLAFFRQELRDRQELDGVRGNLTRGSLGDRFAAQLGMDPRVLTFAIAHQPASQQDGEQTIDSQSTLSSLPLLPSNQSATPALETLEQIQTLVEVIPELPDQSDQPEQSHQPPSAPMGYQTARTAVHDALENKTPLLMEVTIGGNDYTPALLPALEWLADPPSSGRRLVISCSNAGHARRLVEQVLPRLQTLLKSEMTVAYLAGQDGYLCTHRWFGAALRRTDGELSAEQARGLAKLGLWAQQTLTGERSELTMLPQEMTAWERISSGVERIPLAEAEKRAGTIYDQCVYRRKGYCFVSRAEERVNAADIVVTTHAGLLDDLLSSHSLLTTIDHRLLLDADLLEEEVARWGSAELDQARLISTLNTIGTELPDGRYQGLLALAAPALRENGPGGLSTTHTIAKSELDARMRTWFQTLHQATISVNALFGSFSSLLEEFVQGSGGSGGSGREKGKGQFAGRGGRTAERSDQPLRLNAQLRNLGSWRDVERAWQHTAQRLQSVIDLVHEAERMILTVRRSRHRDAGNSSDDSVIAELAALAWRLEEQKQLGQQALALGESDMVYWLRMPPPSPPAVHQMAHQRQTTPPAPSALPPEHYPVLYTQPVQTPALLRHLLLDDDSSTIFAGTALAVDNSFSFCRSRFGFEHDICPALSVVTEHHEQTLVYLPNDVPEPNMPQYQRSLDEALVQLASALEGQVVALFTSHAALRSSYGAIKPVLEAKGILVLGQGIDGSPRQLWYTFTTQERVIILGAGSFWDNMGEVTTSPICTVIARLPMPVLNDPPMAARAEHYSDQLHQLTVPVAALRVRRALNRLVWSDTRRNAVVLFDRRVLSKEYGPTILHTLPSCSQRQSGLSPMSETILDWLTATGSWD